MRVRRVEVGGRSRREEDKKRTARWVRNDEDREDIRGTAWFRVLGAEGEMSEANLKRGEVDTVSLGSFTADDHGECTCHES